MLRARRRVARPDEYFDDDEFEDDCFNDDEAERRGTRPAAAMRERKPRVPLLPAKLSKVGSVCVCVCVLALDCAVSTLGQTFRYPRQRLLGND